MDKNELNQWEVLFLISVAILAILLFRYHKEIINLQNYISSINFWIYPLAIFVFLILGFIAYILMVMLKAIGRFSLSVHQRIQYKTTCKQNKEISIQIEKHEAEWLLLQELPIDEQILKNEIDKLRNKLNVYRNYKELKHFITKFKERLAEATALLNKLKKKKLLQEINEEKCKSQRLDEKEIDLEEPDNESQVSSDIYGKTKFVGEQKAYITDDLSLGDKSFLLSNGFIHHTQNNLDCKEKTYIVFEDKYESPNHIICVKEIVDYLKKFTDEINTYRTVMPDIVFTCNDKSYAIEVETGTIIKDKKKMQNKIELLNKNYKNNWFFFVTNRNMEKEYAKLGKVATKRNIKLKIKQIFKETSK